MEETDILFYSFAYSRSLLPLLVTEMWVSNGCSGGGGAVVRSKQKQRSSLDLSIWIGILSYHFLTSLPALSLSCWAYVWAQINVVLSRLSFYYLIIFIYLTVQLDKYPSRATVSGWPQNSTCARNRRYSEERADQSYAMCQAFLFFKNFD